MGLMRSWSLAPMSLAGSVPRTTPKRCAGIARPPRTEASGRCSSSARDMEKEHSDCPRTKVRPRDGFARRPIGAMPRHNTVSACSYWEGRGVVKDQAEAALLFAKGDERKNANAMVDIGR